ncbi:MAG TPA: hypothetical protein VNO30_25365 [Kofleriaceae bacterium]|nr:hypothetical protein [Kofleriaceae bacterium]
MVRRVVQIVVGVLAVWLVVLVVLGFTHAARTGRQVADRFGDSLQGSATFTGADLSLVRGALDLQDLAVRRDDVLGKLSLDVAGVSCDLPPLGLALVDRDCSELSIDGMRLEVSALALLRPRKGKRPPMRADRVVIRDAVLGFGASAFAPNLGRVQIRVERAVAGPTRFRTPLSWLFALRELRASFDLPAGLTVHLVYRGGMMSAAGSLFGSEPVEIPVSLPVREAADDGAAELRRLVEFGKRVAEELVARRAQEWLRSKLPGR